MSPGARFRLLLGASALALTGILLATSAGTFRALDDQRAVYLRSRAGHLAGLLETLPLDWSSPRLAEELADEEPGLVDLTIIAPGAPAAQDPRLLPLWTGQRLYLTEELEAAGEKLLRTWVPFHAAGRTLIARIDLAAASADFLLTSARRNLWVSLAGGAALILLAIALLWTTHRMGQMQQRHLEMEHLAQIGKMSAVLAHEIRNPLGAIKGFAQLLAENAPAEQRALLEPILGETSRLETLVNELLQYGRPPQPQPREVRWAEIVRPLADHASASPVRFSANGADFALRTDPHLLHEALLNLLRNAIEAVSGDPAGEVRLDAAAEPGNGAVIRLSDNGPGIPPEVRARLFDPFVTTKAAGAGLGLPISRKLVRALGGELELQPAQPRGTVAILRFPRHALVRPREL